MNRYCQCMLPVICLAALVLCPPPGSAQQGGSGESWKRYTNEVVGVSFRYPGRWTTSEGSEPGSVAPVFTLGGAAHQPLIFARALEDPNRSFSFMLFELDSIRSFSFAKQFRPEIEKMCTETGARLDSFQVHSPTAATVHLSLDANGETVDEKIVAVTQPFGLLVWVFTAPEGEFDEMDRRWFAPMLDKETVKFSRSWGLLIPAAEPTSGTPRFPHSDFPDPIVEEGASGWGVLLALLLCLIFVGCVAVLYTEGMWGNALRLVNVVTAGLLAVNFFEPLARLLDGWFPTFTVFWDFLALWLLFGIFLCIFRLATDRLSKVKVRFLKIADRIGSVFFAGCVGWAVICFMMMTLHTAPLAENFMFDGFQPQKRMLLGLAPDRQWLEVVRHTSGGPFRRLAPAEQPDRYVFDPHNDFMVKYAFRRALLEEYLRMTGSYRVLGASSFQ